MMIKFKYIYFSLLVLPLIFMLMLFVHGKTEIQQNKLEPLIEQKKSVPTISKIDTVKVLKDIKIADYFKFMDSLVHKYDTLISYKLNEHILVRNNPWIIDSLSNTGYYKLMKRGLFVFDQKELIAIQKNKTLIIPDSLSVEKLLKNFNRTVIDINIPEYKLRIYKNDTLLYVFPIRVGQNKKRYLKMGNRVTDLRTITGKGVIVRHAKNPSFYNPVNNRRFTHTYRDDGKLTLMPLIPWIETEINGVRNGQLIHPTTNPNTLGKAYSNGCIGVNESDMWIVYYYAPLGTNVNIRYDLKVKGENGDVVSLKNIYGYKNK